MTKAQERSIEMLRKKAMSELFFGGAEKYEFKQFEVKEYEGYLSLTIETGLKGDEGTMAEICARDYCFLFVGDRGGVTWYSRKGTKRYWCEHRSVLQAVIDQR